MPFARLPQANSRGIQGSLNSPSRSWRPSLSDWAGLPLNWEVNEQANREIESASTAGGSTQHGAGRMGVCTLPLRGVRSARQ
jgi:hypothetical protein